ncbi:glycosyltransferase family 4 protein [Pedococcus aerophilus]|uniref:D-inositol 3-phosphate glycosyltransferase n=1 Tax=Pedococcus aerophilus TaxID=436356 RepID=A0ABP6H9V0_9MICO
MRILVLCTDQGVRVPGTKGAALHLGAVTRAFAQLGHEVLLMGVAGHDAPDVDCRTWLLSHPGRAEGRQQELNKLALTAQFATRGLDVAVSFAPDVVYERLSLFGTAGLALADATGAEHVLEVNAILSREQSRWRGLHHVEEAVRREELTLCGADQVVAVSDEVAQAVREVRGERVHTVPNGFDEQLFEAEVDRDAVRGGWGVGGRERVAVFVGTLRPWHGVEHAVRALPHAPREVRLVVVGDGPGRLELERLAEQCRVSDRVVLTGALSHTDAVAAVRSADLGLAPYPELDDFAFSPLKLYEYLAAGLPFVASRLGQISALVDEYGSGLLVQPGDPLALAEGIRSTVSDAGAADRADRARTLAFDRCGWRARASQILTLTTRTGVAVP